MKLIPILLTILLLVAACDDDSGESTPEPQGLDCPTTAEEPDGLFLTWQDDPTTTMTIDWHVEPVSGDDETDEADKAADEPRTALCFRQVDDSVWSDESDAKHVEPGQYDRLVYRTELTGLEPGQEYVFQVGDFEREFRFRTMPDSIDDEPLVFATGGDTMHLPQLFEPTNEVVMDYDPQFIAWGGDLAYADGGTDSGSVDRWRMWFDSILDTLVHDDGRVVPIIAGVGNHEVDGGYYFNHDDYEQADQHRQALAPFYYSLFAFPGQPGYGVLDFADYLSIVALDTDHTNPIEGEQTDWLESTLSEREDRGVTHIIPVYHVAAFPSHRDLDGKIKTRIREHWVPHFEEYGVRLAFENHDHTYKRTHPIRDGEVDDDGIVYIGDGAWGVITRRGDSRGEWYIDEFASEKHGLIVTLDGEDHHVLAIDQDGEILDEYGTIP